jgi:TatD DNase family protein
MAFDTHTHLQFEQFDGDRERVIRECLDAGVSEMAIVGTDMASTLEAIRLCAERSQLQPTGGVHPHDASRYDRKTEENLSELAATRQIVAIGEIGLDFYRNVSPPEVQEAVFQRQLALAARHDLPIVVHTRAAFDQAYELLERWSDGLPTGSEPCGVMHCFSGGVDQALAFVQLGFMISLPATITYPKNDEQRAVAAAVPLNWLVVETDSPYLPPQDKHGHRNEPSAVLDVIAEVARVRGEPFAKVEEATSSNARRLFRV